MFLVIMEKISLPQCRAHRASNDANLNIILAVINIKHEHGTLPPQRRDTFDRRYFMDGGGMQPFNEFSALLHLLIDSELCMGAERI